MKRKITFDAGSNVGMRFAGNKVIEVMSGNQAEKAGVHNGWVVTKINDKITKKKSSITNILSETKIKGEKIVFEFKVPKTNANNSHHKTNRASSGPLPFPTSESWRHRPLYIRLNPMAKDQKILGRPLRETETSDDLAADEIEVNRDQAVFEFETDLFKGLAIIRIVNASNAGSDSYFTGRNRTMQTTIQGVFKKNILMKDVQTGQEFNKPFVNIPAQFVIRPVMAIIRKLSPTLEADFFCDRPYMLSPLICTAQAMHVTPSLDEAQDILEEPIEKTGLIRKKNNLNAGSFGDSRSERKSFFNQQDNLSNCSFHTGIVYTMDFYQHMFHPNTYEFNAGIRNVSLISYLNGQPMTIMAKLRDTQQYLWNFEVWHEKLLETTSD